MLVSTLPKDMIIIVFQKYLFFCQTLCRMLQVRFWRARCTSPASKCLSPYAEPARRLGTKYQVKGPGSQNNQGANWVSTRLDPAAYHHQGVLEQQ